MSFSLFKRKRIYADWAATTSIHCDVAKAMKKARKAWANPSAIYKEGVEARRVIEEARARSARAVGAKPEEVYFTSGGTEANCTIIQGVLRTRLEKGIKDVHVVTTSFEHSSVLETLKLFEQHGVKITYVNPDKNGIVSADEILKAITPATALVTVMFANNEIGTIQPVSKIGAGIRKIRAEKMKVDPGIRRDEKSREGFHRDGREGLRPGEGRDPRNEDDGAAGAQFPVFHVDASQAPLWFSCDIEGLRADAMTLDAHKMQGPRGVGALVVRRHVAWEPLMAGGGQERGMRPTTEAPVAICGFAEALVIAQEGREPRAKRAATIRDFFFKTIEKELPNAVINGSLDKRLPNNINISLPDISDAEFAVLFLDKHGVACSTKSSCLKGEDESYAVKALGGDPWRAKKTLRFTLAPDASTRDVLQIAELLKKLPQ
jgi:cysteine desulfurase